MGAQMGQRRAFQGAESIELGARPALRAVTRRDAGCDAGLRAPPNQKTRLLLGAGGPRAPGNSIRTTPSRATPSRATPSRATPSRATPSRATPSRATPSRAKKRVRIRTVFSAWIPPPREHERFAAPRVASHTPNCSCRRQHSPLARITPSVCALLALHPSPERWLILNRTVSSVTAGQPARALRRPFAENAA